MTKIPSAGIASAWKTMGLVVLDFRDLSVQLVMFNIIWCLTSVFIFTLPSATLALVAVCNDLKDRKDVTWRDFFRYFRLYGFVGLRWGILNAVVIVLFIANFFFYGQLVHDIQLIAHGVLMVFAIIWFLVQMYSLPLLFHLEEPSIRTAIRNAVVLILRHILYTVSYAIVAVVFLFMGYIVPYFWLIFMATFLILLYLHGVDYLVQLEIGDAPDLDDALGQS